MRSVNLFSNFVLKKKGMLVIMKFIKGVMLGAVIGAGVWKMYSETNNCTKNKMIKQGKKFIKSLGIM